MNMDKIPGQLLYEVLKFLEIKHFQLIEILTQGTKLKLGKNLSALKYLLRQKHSITKELTYEKCKKAIYGIANPACYYFRETAYDVYIYNPPIEQVTMLSLNVQFKSGTSWAIGPSMTVYLSGGYLYGLRYKECYLLADKALTKQPNMSHDRSHHCSIYTENAYYVFGGYGPL